MTQLLGMTNSSLDPKLIVNATAPGADVSQGDVVPRIITIRGVPSAEERFFRQRGVDLIADAFVLW